MSSNDSEGNCSGSPVQVLVFDSEKNYFCVQKESLTKILSHESAAQLPCVVLSIVGAFRRGKSFLLNFFVKFLSYCQKNPGYLDDPSCDKRAWLGEENFPLDGFCWKGGTQRVTSGIVMWDQPFILTDHSGTKIAVFLMDTQGAFDSQSTMKDCATIFALSTLLSSVQLFNITGNIQEDQLNNLQFFTEYGRMALASTDSKPFQRLTFLVRDWVYPYEYPYGLSSTYLSKVLSIPETAASELKDVRSHINSCFEALTCYLMPHPGMKVAVDPQFNGCIKDIEPEFINYLNHLVYDVFSSEARVFKMITDKQVSSSDLLLYFENYVGIFQADDIPAPTSIFEATSEANHMLALNHSLEYYCTTMNTNFGPPCGYVAPQKIDQTHTQVLSDSVKKFNETKKMGTVEKTAYYRQKLETQIEDEYLRLKDNNKSKSILNSFKFLALAIPVIILFALLSYLLDLVGLDAFMWPFDYLVMIVMTSCAIWTYLRITGTYPNVALSLDSLADLIWNHAVEIVFEKHLGEKFSAAPLLLNSLRGGNNNSQESGSHVKRRLDDSGDRKKQ